MTRILIIDDEPTYLELMQDYLRFKGFEVSTAKDGDEAIKQMRYEKPDLILLDIMMPTMDGYQFCRTLKADAAFWDIPIIVVTAIASDRGERMMQGLGAAAYLEKPIDQDQLLKLIRKHLPGPTGAPPPRKVL